MLTIGHFIGKEKKITRVMNLSKRGEETQLEFKRTAHFLGGYLAISYLLHALHAVLLCLLHSPSGASRPRVSNSKRNTARRTCSNQYLFKVVLWPNFGHCTTTMNVWERVGEKTLSTARGRGGLST